MIGPLRVATLRLTIPIYCGIDLVSDRHTLNINDRNH